MVLTRIQKYGEAYAAENAVIVGDVTLGEGASVWFGAVLRGDDAAIRVGEGTNLQDMTMVHPDPDVPSEIGALVTVGHRAILHGKRIEDRCLIGMGSILLAGSVIGEGSIVGAGSVVREHVVIPPRSLVVGVPGKVVRRVTDDEYAFSVKAAEDYVEKARRHLAGEYLP